MRRFTRRGVCVLGSGLWVFLGAYFSGRSGVREAERGKGVALDTTRGMKIERVRGCRVVTVALVL